MFLAPFVDRAALNDKSMMTSIAPGTEVALRITQTGGLGCKAGQMRERRKLCSAKAERSAESARSDSQAGK
jgi:hypothetical protein